MSPFDPNAYSQRRRQDRWLLANGPINPTHRGVCKLCVAGAGMAALFVGFFAAVAMATGVN